MAIDMPIAMHTPLFTFVETDDIALANQKEIIWFHLLREFDWYPYQLLAAKYYDALFRRNLAAAEASATATCGAPNPETKDEATQRLLFNRPTLQEGNVPILHYTPLPKEKIFSVDPDAIEPGKPPMRLAGKRPKCFFAMLKSFLGVSLMGKMAEPELVYQELLNNPAFARACGFTTPEPRYGYRQSDVPAYRKLEQFDQIMSEEGLWAEMKWEEIKANIASNAIVPETIIVHDTTHYPAYSGMTVVPYEDENGKTKKKSHPRTTKPCRCEDRENCPHEWINADEGAGTVVKSSGKMYWGHKASTLCIPGQEVILDAVAMNDASSHDSTSLEEHLDRLFGHLPETKTWFTTILDDGAADDAGLKGRIKSAYGLDLRTSQNPRGRKPLAENLPRGIDRVTPTGTPVCKAGYSFDLLGARKSTKVFIFAAPKEEDGTPVCGECEDKAQCCPQAEDGRRITIPWSRLYWIDPEFPQLSVRFQKLMAMRTSIERLHTLMKYDFGEPRLRKRGNISFQALLDKILFAMHFLLGR